MKAFHWFVASLLLAGSLQAGAQAFPTKPLRVIGGFAPGGIVDLMARTFNEKLAELLGQQVLVEAKPGADGSIGTEFVARSAPDGYTLFLAASVHVTLPAMTRTPWHPTKDFAGIATISVVPNLVVVPSSLGVSTLKEFVDYARARPGKLNSLNGGTAGAQNVTTELLKKAAHFELVPVGFKGLPLGVPDLIAGRLHFAVLPPALAESHLKSGALRALATTSATRSAQWPNVPTLVELGYPDAFLNGWYVLVAPAGTPKPVIARLNAEVNKALADAGVLARIAKLGADPLPGSTPGQVDEMLQKEYTRLDALAKEIGLKIQ